MELEPDIYTTQNGATWTLQAVTQRAAHYLGLSAPGNIEYPAAEAIALVRHLQSMGWIVQPTF